MVSAIASFEMESSQWPEVIASIETVSATLFAVLWLGTSFSWIDIVGFVFIMATVFVLAKHPGDGDIKSES